jgi:methylphosphotriester-DNA--protein-cysteine methyltransferase
MVTVTGARFRPRQSADTTAGIAATEGRVDALRGLIEAGTSMRGADRTVVQIIARPASRRRLARARKTLTPQSGSVAKLVLDL